MSLSKKEEEYKHLVENQFIKLEQDDIIEANKEHIKRFIREVKINGLSYNRQMFYISKLRMLAKGLKKDFNKLSKEDIKELVFDKIETKDYTKWTKTGYRLTLRLLYKFLAGIDWKDNVTLHPEKVRWLDISRPKNELEGEELLNSSDIKRVLDCCRSTQDKAIVSLLYESGFRSEEFLSLKIKSLRFTNQGVFVTVNAKKKTGARTIRVIYSAQILIEWLSIHPFKDNPDAPLWINESTCPKYRNNPLGKAGLSKRLKRLVEKAGVKKKANPHAWRHARATELARKLTESELRKYMGWTKGSKMPEVYVHLTSRDLDDAILRMHNLKPLKDNNKDLTLINCPRCNSQISSISKFCSKCGLILDDKEASKGFLVGEQFITEEVFNKFVKKIMERIKAERHKSRFYDKNI